MLISQLVNHLWCTTCFGTYGCVCDIYFVWYNCARWCNNNALSLYLILYLGMRLLVLISLCFGPF